jgi:hypothetical protein
MNQMHCLISAEYLDSGYTLHHSIVDMLEPELHASWRCNIESSRWEQMRTFAETMSEDVLKTALVLGMQQAVTEQAADRMDHRPLAHSDHIVSIGLHSWQICLEMSIVDAELQQVAILGLGAASVVSQDIQGRKLELASGEEVRRPLGLQASHLATAFESQAPRDPHPHQDLLSRRLSPYYRIALQLDRQHDFLASPLPRVVP